MAQLRHDYEQFKAADSDVLVIVPNGPRMIERHIQAYSPPYRILSDKGGVIANQFGAAPKNLAFLTAFKPAVFLVDRAGKLVYTNYTPSYVTEPDNREPLALLAQLAR